MKRAVILTGHFPQQKRRGSMLWISDHLQRIGWHVTHVTVGYSWLSRLSSDPRLRVLDSPPRIGTHAYSPTLTTVFGFAPVHPISLRHGLLDRMAEPLWPVFPAWWRSKLSRILPDANLVICESGPPVMLAPILKEFAPDALRIYRVNDDIRLLNAAPALVRAETRNLTAFTRISTASPIIAHRLRAHPNVTLDPMGIPHDRLTAIGQDPFKNRAGFRIAVCAGTTQIDMPALLRLSDQRPNWRIHVLGRTKGPPSQRDNLHWHGEQSFDTTLSFVAHADIGLAPYCDAPGIEYQTSNSNRMLLYRHFGLPILGPDRLCDLSVPSVIGYSERDALERCETWARQPERIPDWSTLAARLAQNAVTDPPCEVSMDPETIVKPRVKTVPAFASNA